MTRYGRAKKKVIFEETDKRHADLKIKLHYNGLTQAQFFRGMVSAFLDDDPDMLVILETIKKENKVSGAKRAIAAKERKKASETVDLFGLDDKEVENIFDILEKEHPDL